MEICSYLPTFEECRSPEQLLELSKSFFAFLPHIYNLKITLLEYFITLDEFLN